jgi:mannose-6-phosphate isomerase-like protein (cupin superfamily)
MQVRRRPDERNARVDHGRRRDKHRDVPISFFDLLAEDGWEPLTFFQGDPTFYWNDGGFVANAPVDIAATLDGAVWRSTNVEPAFKWQGRKIRPDFTVPKRHVNRPQLMIVVGGHLTVEYGEKGEEIRELGPGEFWTADAKVPFVITSGPDGATYLECWDEELSLIETTWHDDDHWKRRESASDKFPQP